MRPAGARPARREEGFSLFLMISLAVCGSVVALGLMERIQSMARDRVRCRAAEAARWAAEGGIEKARAALAADPAWTGAVLDVGGNRVEVRVEAVEGDGRLRRVRSLGVDPGLGTEATAAKRTLAAVLRLGPGGPRIVEWREEP